MFVIKKMLISIVLVLMCSSVVYAHVSKNPNLSGVTKKEVVDDREPIMIRVTGYGAYQNKEDANSEPKRLMAKRASKLDAYRALAERIYGIGISGASSVSEFVMKDDAYATAVDSYVRGARVVSIIENKGRGFETVLEVLLPGGFEDCLNKVNNIKHGADCLSPLPMSGSIDLSNKRKSSHAMQSIYHLK